MKVQFRVLCLSFLLFCGFSCMANDNNSISTTQITLQPGQEQFVIEVKAIPTTGYVWSVKFYDKAQFSFEGSHYIKQEAEAKVGSPLQEQFTFKVLKPLKDSQKIQLKLARSWEKSDAKESTFIITSKKTK